MKRFPRFAHRTKLRPCQPATLPLPTGSPRPAASKLGPVALRQPPPRRPRTPITAWLTWCGAAPRVLRPTREPSHGRRQLRQDTMQICKVSVMPPATTRIGTSLAPPPQHQPRAFRQRREIYLKALARKARARVLVLRHGRRQIRQDKVCTRKVPAASQTNARVGASPAPPPQHQPRALCQL